VQSSPPKYVFWQDGGTGQNSQASAKPLRELEERRPGGSPGHAAMGGRFSGWALLLLAIAAIVDAGPGPLLAPMRLFPSFDECSAQPPWVVAYAAIESTKVNVAGKCTAFATQASDLCNNIKAQMGPEGFFSPAAKDSRREYLQSLPPAQKTAILMVLTLARSHLTRPKRRHGLVYCDYPLLSFVRTHISQQRRRL